MSSGARVTTLVLVVLLVSLCSSLAALYTAREMERVMGSIVTENVPSLTAASELQAALLQQRGLVATYMLDDGRLAWINDLDKLKPALAHWLAEAKRTARTDGERNILARLTGVYAEYDGARERAIALYHTGHKLEARTVLLGDVSRLSEQAYALCRSFEALNERAMQTAHERSRRQVASLALTLPALVGLSTLLCCAVLIVVSRRLLTPVRRMADDARAFTNQTAGASRQGGMDEVDELEFYSRAIMSDVTRTRSHLAESQQRLLDAEKLAAVGKFAACAAHELRSPLSAMKMWLYQLRLSAADPAAVTRECGVLEEEVARLEDLATSFLRFSKPPELRLLTEDMSEVLDGALELARPRLEAKQVRVTRERAGDLPPVMADARQLRQVLLNLLSNAADAVPRGGEVHITETRESDAEGHRELVIRVRDNGPGIPPEVRPQLFEAFVSSKPNGTGLGLCIASSIVTRHGGRLELEEHDGPGASFALHLPGRES